MAGLFGFFDYTKEGKGVNKDELPKKRFFLFFDVYFRKFWKLAQLNLLFLLCCIPIITIGAALSGFTFVLRNFSREDHAFILSDFIRVSKKNWKMGTIVFIFNILAAYVLFVGHNMYSAMPNLIGTIGLTVIYFSAVLLIFMNFYIYTMIVTFNFTLKQLYKNAFIFAIIGLWRNILILFLLLVLGFATYLFLPPSVFLIIFILISLAGFIVSFITYPVIKTYLIDPALKQEEEKQLNSKGEEQK